MAGAVCVEFIPWPNDDVLPMLADSPVPLSPVSPADGGGDDDVASVESLSPPPPPPPPPSDGGGGDDADAASPAPSSSSDDDDDDVASAESSSSSNDDSEFEAPQAAPDEVVPVPPPPRPSVSHVHTRSRAPTAKDEHLAHKRVSDMPVPDDDASDGEIARQYSAAVRAKRQRTLRKSTMRRLVQAAGVWPVCTDTREALSDYGANYVHETMRIAGALMEYRKGRGGGDAAPRAHHLLTSDIAAQALKRAHGQAVY